MKKFFELYERYGAFTLEIGHNSVADWCIFIWHRKGKQISEVGKPDISVQNPSRKKAFKEAYHKFSEYVAKQ